MYIIGTLHSYQFGAGSNIEGLFCTEENEQSFQSAILAVCKRYCIAAIAEEMSITALQEQSVSISVPKKVSDILGIGDKHLYCDPSREQQESLGIRDENTVKAYGMLTGKSESEISEDQIVERRKREPIWRDNLLKSNNWPLLFICGYWHVPTFSEEMRKAGYSVKVLYKNWNPNLATSADRKKRVG
ncbi:MAG: hypothetical protein KJ714_03905 [Euryarchaeota archaeon]|nr:hypothetical protein [Euryarchaeota archaeon]